MKATHPLNESPVHWHYIVHFGPNGRTREFIGAESYKTVKAAFAAARRVIQADPKLRKSAAFAGIDCRHPS